jgi:MFS family permease
MPERAPGRSIYVLFLLFLINLMNFFDRTIPAVVLETIRKFGLDDTALGILGASFTLIYAVAGVPLGYLADRFPPHPHPRGRPDGLEPLDGGFRSRLELHVVLLDPPAGWRW